MSNGERHQPNEASIARLLRAAGRGPTASAEARERIYRNVHAEWRNEVAAGVGGKSPRTPRRAARDTLSHWLWRGLPVAAALAVAVVALQISRGPGPALAGPELATVTKVLGTATIVTTDDATAAVAAATTIVHAGDTVTTGADGGVSLTLRGGLNLRVASGSEVLLGSNESIELRRGTVYLDTGASPEQEGALEIATPFGTVWHRGTQYEARVGSNNLRIRIREGEVGFRDAGGEVIGSAGEQLLVTASSAPLRSAISRTGMDWTWVEQLAAAPSADQYRVIDLLTWIARETGRELDFANDAAAASARTAMLVGVAGLSPAETLEVIGSTTALRYELAEDGLLLY
ncbi:MAG TPA: FecR family protein [Gammaproteobacteria bacterium]|nr:FecR family protein [Gammaproteobacteria bacterium]